MVRDTQLPTKPNRVHRAADAPMNFKRPRPRPCKWNLNCGQPTIRCRHKTVTRWLCKQHGADWIATFNAPQDEE